MDQSCLTPTAESDGWFCFRYINCGTCSIEPMKKCLVQRMTLGGIKKKPLVWDVLKHSAKHVFPKVQQSSWVFKIITSSFYVELGKLSDFKFNSNFKKELLHRYLWNILCIFGSSRSKVFVRKANLNSEVSVLEHLLKIAIPLGDSSRKFLQNFSTVLLTNTSSSLFLYITWNVFVF